MNEPIKPPRAAGIVETDAEVADELDDDKKDDLDVVIFYQGEYYYLAKDEWLGARKLAEGERSVLVPLVENGTVVAHVDEDSPRFGSWSNLLNLDSLMRMHKEK